MHRLTMLLAVLAAGPVAAEDAPQTFSLHNGTALKAASVEQVRDALAGDDRFTTVLSRFDLESRLGRLDVTRKDYNAFVRQAALPWDPDLLKKVLTAAGTVRSQIQKQQLSLPLPKEILLIHTTGKEEGNAAYCRGPAIVLPQGLVAKARPERLASLMAHELFHVLSGNNEPLQRKLYATIGFKPCPSIALPADLAPRKLTNPDGPGLNYYIDVQHQGRKYQAVPLLLASIDRYDPRRGGSFFKYLQFRLMAVEPNGDRWRPLAGDDGPLLLDAKQNDSYFQQIGRNTNYIIHPDEILADNFVFLLQGKQKLESPQVVERMRQILSQAE